MNKDDLWAIYTRRNPRFLTGPVELTPAGLRKFFDQTWEQAHKQGVANGQALTEGSVCETLAGIFGETRP